MRISNILKYMKSKEALEKEEQSDKADLSAMLKGVACTSQHKFREGLHIYLAKRLLTKHT